MDQKSFTISLKKIRIWNWPKRKKKLIQIIESASRPKQDYLTQTFVFLSFLY